MLADSFAYQSLPHRWQPDRVPHSGPASCGFVRVFPGSGVIILEPTARGQPLSILYIAPRRHKTSPRVDQDKVIAYPSSTIQKSYFAHLARSV